MHMHVQGRLLRAMGHYNTNDCLKHKDIIIEVLALEIHITEIPSTLHGISQ